MTDRFGWYPYVTVAARRAKAQRQLNRLRRQGRDIQPVAIQGQKIARTFWGRAWCDHLESFSDYANRLPRGRSYLRHGAVCHLEILPGAVRALVSGTDLYEVSIGIRTLPLKKWDALKGRCAGRIGSLLELLQGRLSDHVMGVVTDRREGLFPLPGEIRLACTCPDWADMCKHVAAVLYGVGARLDQRPELLFQLRGVNQEELIETGVAQVAAAAGPRTGRRRIADEALAGVFGIELAEADAPGRDLRGPDEAAPAQPPCATRVITKKRPGRGLAKDGGPPAPAPRRTPRDRKTAAAGAPTRTPTGKAVARLRTRFGMTQGEFARLLGVSAGCVGNWERRPGRLDLHQRTRAAWDAVQALTKTQAWRQVRGK